MKFRGRPSITTKVCYNLTKWIFSVLQTRGRHGIDTLHVMIHITGGSNLNIFQYKTPLLHEHYMYGYLINIKFRLDRFPLYFYSKLFSAIGRRCLTSRLHPMMPQLMGDVYAEAACYGWVVGQYCRAIGLTVETQMVFVLAAWGPWSLAPAALKIALVHTAR